MSILPVEKKTIDKAVALLADGKLVALPTETVYGLAADATNGKAVASIFAVKGRPQFNPLIVHVNSIGMAERFVHIDSISQKLMNAFWPGPLTLVLALKDEHTIHPLSSAGLPTLAIRQPQGVFADIVTQLDVPLAAPSANLSGRLSPTSAQDVSDMLGDQIPLIVDAGAASVGVESTIVKVTHEGVFLLRPGGVISEEIEALIKMPLKRMEQHTAIEAPGMLKSHYAPLAKVRLNAKQVEDGEALLAFGESRISQSQKAIAMLNLSKTANLTEAATNLFHFLKELDQKNIAQIAVEPIPNYGLGEAINDRLQRAAAPRG
ncbi:L-threonylcarbamoyladenylate synthase [Bartonella tamiae]|uniref:Threonylcarbamoyl-AMP synthase n=1 Tax=Bartonella tamiae Th239 TaxID=1094558 RepID=J0ZPK0_9HYPH|nr:L-threonylcarbamoyladenylate synthase [Bartonella tamiae]EJF90508.1 Sua5/YciO/YrdC/YwlC family protein [Bartonella tamiae Th239]EJF93548.1 Sua5/YciO/YrdC/YwlC family protein [Bartonella tamiae Th307]